MASSLALRHVRHLSTAAATTAVSSTATASSTITVSQAKSKLRYEHDPDKALEIYSSVSNRYTSPVASRYTQDITIRRFAKSRRFADIESLLESHKNDPKIREEPFLTTLIRSYGIAGMFDQALRTYNQMDELGTPRSPISFNALLSACIHSKLFDQVPKLFDEMPQRYGFSADKVSYGMLVKAYGEAGSPDLAIKTMREMEEKGVEVTAITFTTILHSLYKLAKNEEAERLWNEMLEKGIPLDVAAYNVRVMHVHGGDPERVKELIEEMSNSGLKPDTISFNYLITSYLRNGMIDEAIKVYNALEGNGCNPNAATFRTMIFDLCKNGRFEKGYKMFKESVRVHKIPDFNTLKHLVEGLAKKSLTKEAKGVIRTVKKKFPPSFLNAWKKLEEDLGLLAATTSSATAETEKATE